MNDARFKELLNLHLVHRLNADEAHELEQVLQTDPARRREFRHYAVLERGCAELFRRSASDAPAPDSLVRALRAAEARMSARDERRLVVWGWGTWGATAGMAALVALVVARVSQPVFVAVEDGKSADASSATPSLALATNSAPVSPPYVSRRSALPAHLTLAALGIASEQGEPDSSMSSRWQATDEQQVARLDNSAAAHAASWMTASTGSVSEWSGASASAAQFSGRPINAWGTQSGFQAQSAAYTFER
jgi:hypothetical protein